MQQKFASQMIDDLNLIDEGLSRSLLDENGFLHRQQERMLFLGNTTASGSPANYNGNGPAAIEKQVQVQNSGAEMSTPGKHNLADTELHSLFHRYFRNLLTALQKNIDFDQILLWARSVMEKCVIRVSQAQLSAFLLLIIRQYSLYLFGERVRSVAVSCQSATALSAHTHTHTVVVQCLHRYR